MTTYIYADLMFIINFLSDYLILFLTAKFTCSRTTFLRLILSSFVGALFATITVCTALSGIILAVLVILVSFIMCLLAFGKRRKRSIVGLMFFFYLSATLLYGGIYAMLSFFSMIFSSLGRRPQFLLITGLIILSGIIYLLFSSFYSKVIKESRSEVKVEIFDGFRTYNLDFLCDSGNFARDPFSGKPVTIVKKDAVDKELFQAITESFDEKITPERYHHIKPRVIPVKTVGGTTLLYAFVPQSMFVYNGKEKYRLDSIVAIDTHENAFLGRDGLISAELLDFI